MGAAGNEGKVGRGFERGTAGQQLRLNPTLIEHRPLAQFELK